MRARIDRIKRRLIPHQAPPDPASIRTRFGWVGGAFVPIADRGHQTAFPFDVSSRLQDFCLSLALKGRPFPLRQKDAI